MILQRRKGAGWPSGKEAEEGTDLREGKKKKPSVLQPYAKKR